MADSLLVLHSCGPDIVHLHAMNWKCQGFYLYTNVLRLLSFWLGVLIADSGSEEHLRLKWKDYLYQARFSCAALLVNLCLDLATFRFCGLRIFRVNAIIN